MKLKQYMERPRCISVVSIINNVAYVQMNTSLLTCRDDELHVNKHLVYLASSYDHLKAIEVHDLATGVIKYIPITQKHGLTIVKV